MCDGAVSAKLVNLGIFLVTSDTNQISLNRLSLTKANSKANTRIFCTLIHFNLDRTLSNVVKEEMNDWRSSTKKKSSFKQGANLCLH